MSTQSRREFLEQSLFAAATAAMAASGNTAQADDASNKPKGASERLRVACIGVNDRGEEHLQYWGHRKDCEVAAIVDVDEAVGQKRTAEVEKRSGKEPTYYRDLRKMLEDKSIDIVSIATPNHWHALAAIWSIQAGKDVYVEKPVSHNVSEGRRIVQAARKHNRIVQTGTQCRSMKGMRDAIAYVQSGKIGEVKLARGLCYKHRGSIGPRGNYTPPVSVDYKLWLGPATEKPLTRRNLHYDWHWMWDYGNGDLGNQGIHQMDICRWGLGVNDIGQSVLSYGGRLGYEDAGETANSQVSIHEYPDRKRIVFEVRGLKTQPLMGAAVGVIFYGTEGIVVVPKYTGGVAFDLKQNIVAKFSGGPDNAHIVNFVGAVRSRKYSDLNADILEGHRSSALCHLANISYRLGEQISGKEALRRLNGDNETAKTFERFRDHLSENEVAIADSKALRFGKLLTINPTTETFNGSGAEESNPYLTREYRAPFIVPAEKDV